MNLSNTQLFRGIDEQEISSLLDCLTAQKRCYQKGYVILAEGTVTEHIGIVLDGMAMISYNDAWGNISILGNVSPGATFAEAYACIPGQPLPVTVFAAEETTVMFLNVWHVATTCTNACPFHATLTRNLLTVCAKHAGSNSFHISYNRQQLADYLNVDRSTMCNELSKMQKDHLIEYKRSR